MTFFLRLLRRFQIRALTENNPELRNALTDPETIRQRCVRACVHAYALEGIHPLSPSQFNQVCRMSYHLSNPACKPLGTLRCGHR